MPDIIDTRDIDGVEYRVYLERDPDCENPREYDSNAGKIVAASSKYVWPVEDGDTLAGHRIAAAVEEYPFRNVSLWLRVFHGATAVLPLYHGADDRPSPGGETDAPDVDNYIGVTFDQPSTRSTTGILADHVAVALAVDVEEFGKWAVSETYGYVIERQETDDSDSAMLDGSGWEQVDSCWGFIGFDYAWDEAKRQLWDI